jgi:LysM repeat protein
MKRIFVWFFILSFSVAAARAQDTATQQQIDKLNGQVQDLLDAQATQNKRIEALEKEIGQLHDQLNQPDKTANQDDLKKLAEQVQEIDRKRQEDNERVLKELERLGKSLGASQPGRKTTPNVPTTTPAGNPGPAAGSPQKGYDYNVRSGDTLSAIAKAYRDQGIKITTDQILKANPGLNPGDMKIGQKIFIPAPAQQ